MLSDNTPPGNGDPTPAATPARDAGGTTPTPEPVARVEDLLLPRHLADLRNSGLSDQTILENGIRTSSGPEAVLQNLGWAKSRLGEAEALGGCLALPFVGRDGGPSDFVRYKPDRPRTDGNGKKIKYESPIGKGNRAYLPVCTRPALANPTVPLVLTEGEKKALAGAQAGFTVVGLVGVWGWQQKRPRGKDGKGTGARKLIPDLAGIPWKGRRVDVAFDSDIAEKPAVRWAEWNLAQTLRGLGAEVYAVRLPGGPDGSKVGLDDYLLTHSPAELQSLMDAARPATKPTQTPGGNTTACGAAGGASPGFGVGDLVSPTDRNNIGTISDVLDGGRYKVTFVSREGVAATKEFGANELRPPGASRPPVQLAAGTSASPPKPFVPFPVELLPGPLAKFVREVASAIPCDPAYVALPALATVAGAVGLRRAVRLKSSWLEPGVLWVAVVGESGTTKSPAMKFATQPLVDIERDLVGRHKADLAKHKNEFDEWKKEKKAKKGEDGGTEFAKKPPPFPTARRAVVSDITIEALALILEHNRDAFVYRDELRGWFESFTKYSKGSDEPQWLELYSGGALMNDRKGPNHNERQRIMAPRAAVSVCGTIQPGVLTTSLTHEKFASGLAARLLLAMPPREPKRWSDAEIDSAVSAEYARIVRDLFDRQPEENGEPRGVLLSDKAKGEFKAFVNEWGQATAAAAPTLAATLSKLEGAAARLALLHHLVTRVAARQDELAPLPPESMCAGIGLARWFAAEAERVFAALAETPEATQLRNLADLVRRHGGAMTPRELQRAYSKRYKTVAAAEDELARLVEADMADWAARPSGPKGGQPTRECRLRNQDEGPEVDDGTPGADDGTLAASEPASAADDSFEEPLDEQPDDGTPAARDETAISERVSGVPSSVVPGGESAIDPDGNRLHDCKQSSDHSLQPIQPNQSEPGEVASQDMAQGRTTEDGTPPSPADVTQLPPDTTPDNPDEPDGEFYTVG